jgi:hypothetical protein
MALEFASELIQNKNRCFVPSAEHIKNTADLESALASHDWKIVSSNTYGEAILVTLKCRRCETERINTINSVLIRK